ncbi:MAG: hypothetical protein HYS05_20700 [Acidobacteria bacterium]|nr:hypothetical protein [Acidobacteriota bacterium]
MRQEHSTRPLTALVKQIRARVHATGMTSPRPGESFPRDAVYHRRRWGDALRRLYRLRIVNAKKSKYYDAALSNFERARRCFERAGLVDE